MINLERPPPTQRTLSFVETEAAAFPLAAAAPEVMMKYIESLDGAGEGIFQNNRIAQLKPNCPPFVTVCPGLQLRLAAHLLTEDTTGRLFSQLVTTIGARHPARRRSGKTYFFHSAKTETERQALFPGHSATEDRPHLFGRTRAKQGMRPAGPRLDGAFNPNPKIGLENPEIGLENPEIGLENPEIGLENPGLGAGMKLLLRPHGASDGSRPVSLRKTLINWSKPRGTRAPTEPPPAEYN